jgi:hypothetical protein
MDHFSTHRPIQRFFFRNVVIPAVPWTINRRSIERLCLSASVLLLTFVLVGCRDTLSQSAGNKRSEQISKVQTLSTPEPLNALEKVVLDYCRYARVNDKVKLTRLLAARIREKVNPVSSDGSEIPSYDLGGSLSRQFLEKELPDAIRDANQSVVKMKTTYRHSDKGLVEVSIGSPVAATILTNLRFELVRLKTGWKIVKVEYAFEGDSSTGEKLPGEGAGYHLSS